MLSPTIAPRPAQRMTSGRLRSPAPATTPAVMTVASLGTSGKNASIAETAKTSGYVHQAPDTHWTNWSKMFTCSGRRARGRGGPRRRAPRASSSSGSGSSSTSSPVACASASASRRSASHGLRGQQRAVEVRAVDAAGAAALVAGLAVVAEARDHAAERLGALVEVRAAGVVLEAGERARSGPGAVEQHVADHAPLAGDRVQRQQADARAARRPRGRGRSGRAAGSRRRPRGTRRRASTASCSAGPLPTRSGATSACSRSWPPPT